MLEDKEKMVFVSLQCSYPITKLPFSLHGAAAPFQRLGDKALAQVWDCVVAYTDDILVFRLDWETYLMNLRWVLQAPQEVELMANLKKSHLGQWSVVQYLSFIIGHGQV